jgi:hypothetical protein
MRPRIAAHLLPDNYAQIAVNTRLWSGDAAPFKKPAYVTDLAKSGTIVSIYRFGKSLDDDTKYWFQFTTDADVTLGPIPDDTSERTYYTQAGQPPMVTDSTLATTDGLMPSNGYLLGIPAPTTRAGVTVTPGSGGDDTVKAQNCVLAYTYVSAWGEEGAPCEVSDPFNAKTGDTLNIISMDGPPAGNYNITLKRLYVSITDDSGTATLRFWKEIPVGSTTYSDTLDLTLLGEALPENALIPPPDDMFGLMAHPAGFLVGFSGQRVLRSETYKPYGWPYFSPVADQIVGGAILGQATVICTKGSTYMATQADPITFVPLQLNGWQPCVSKRSIAVLGAFVIYASPDGLVGVDQNGTLSVLTDQLMTRDEWQAYKPESMTTVTHDGRAFIFYDTGTVQGGLIFDPSVGQIVLTDLYATAAYADERRDALFLVVETGKLHKWDADDEAMTQTYQSKQIIAERPQNLGAAKVVADSYPVTFTLDATVETTTGTKAIQVTKTVQNARGFRIKGDYRARDYAWTVQGTGKVSEVIVASTLGNLTAQ